jgi:hypothetical protein
MLKLYQYNRKIYSSDVVLVPTDNHSNNNKQLTHLELLLLLVVDSSVRRLRLQRVVAYSVNHLHQLQVAGCLVPLQHLRQQEVAGCLARAQTQTLSGNQHQPREDSSVRHQRPTPSAPQLRRQVDYSVNNRRKIIKREVESLVNQLQIPLEHNRNRGDHFLGLQQLILVVACLVLHNRLKITPCSARTNRIQVEGSSVRQLQLRRTIPRCLVPSRNNNNLPRDYLANSNLLNKGRRCLEDRTTNQQRVPVCLAELQQPNQ